MPRRALALIAIQNDYFPGGKWTLSGIEASPAAQVHTAFMAALRFGYAKLISTEEYLAGKAK